MPPRRLRVAGTVVLLIGVFGLLVGLHYVPYFNAARSALDGSRQLATEARTLQVGDINAATLERLRAEVTGLRQSVAAAQSLLATDPWVSLARLIPPLRDQLTSTDAVVGAGAQLAAGADVALSLADRFLAVRQGPAAQLLGGLVDMVATSSADVARLRADLDGAQTALAGLKPGAVGQLLDASDAMTSAITRLRPLLSEYDAAAALAPNLLGWGGQRRYLVLAQDPAELRPAGGYTGTFGIVTFQNGNLAGHDFSDVYSLDLKPNLPFVQPPDALSSHLIGSASWQLADANWSPDWPTSAQDALRLYENESGDTHIDGVIALTTYALDGLLAVTGPVRVPEYGIDVAAGKVTITALQLTRGAPNTGGPSGRKAFLDALASAVLVRLQSLPSAQWQPMAAAVQDLAARRLIMVWSPDPAVEPLLAAGPLGGEIRQDAGDYLAVSEANVAPTSKFNLIVYRSTSLAVTIAPDGTLEDTLALGWQNNAGRDGEPYVTLRAYSTSHAGLYGAYVRVLVPSGSQLLDATGDAGGAFTGAESVEPEAGRDAIGNYLLMPPGTSTLSYRWQPTVRATQSAGLWSYDLTIQKQPGTLAEPLALTINLPAGATVESYPVGATAAGSTVTFATSFLRDLDISVGYRLP